MLPNNALIGTLIPRDEVYLLCFVLSSPTYSRHDKGRETFGSQTRVHQPFPHSLRNDAVCPLPLRNRQRTSTQIQFRLTRGKRASYQTQNTTPSSPSPHTYIHSYHTCTRSHSACSTFHMLPSQNYEFGVKRFRLPSRDIPTAMHFLSRQYWHRFRLTRRMLHCWFLVQGRYWIFCWIDRRKKP